MAGGVVGVVDVGAAEAVVLGDGVAAGGGGVEACEVRAVTSQEEAEVALEDDEEGGRGYDGAGEGAGVGEAGDVWMRM